MKSALAMVAVAGLLLFVAGAAHSSSDSRPDPPASFASVLLALRTAVTATRNDLQHERYDAAHPSYGVCYNLLNNIDAEYNNGVQYDMTNDVSFQIGRLETDIGHVRGDLQSLKSDDKVLANDGDPAPAGESETISNGYGAIHTATVIANGYIRQANKYSSQAYDLANSIASKHCSGQGPSGPPSPIAAVGG
jgi:hypothetical protein